MRRVVLFVAWAAVGFVASSVLLYGFTPIGPLILAFGWLAYMYLPTVSGNRRPEAFGAFAGFGSFWLFIATSVDGERLPFVVIGVLSVALAPLAYVVDGHSRCVGSPPST